MISVFELFKIGIGPSSSHTVGPMKAAAAFAKGLVETGAIDRVASLEVALLGSQATDETWGFFTLYLVLTALARFAPAAFHVQPPPFSQSGW